MKIFLIMSVFFVFLTACQFKDEEETRNDVVEIEKQPNVKIEKEKAEDNGKVNDDFINLDELEKHGIVTSTGFRYSESELKEYEEDEARQDYVKVIEMFVQEQLKSQLTLLDTVDGTYNPRQVIISTIEGEFYSIILNRWHAYNGIWTVNRYAQYEKDTMQRNDNEVEYEIMDISNSIQEIQDWGKSLISKNQRLQEYKTLNGDVYVLLTATDNESVELLNIYGTDYYIGVSYANGMPNENQGRKPYILLKVDSSITEIVFKQYSSVLKHHQNLYAP